MTTADALPLERSAIAALIPHAGDMVLIDAVLSWDDESICCCSNSHRDSANPLRHNGQLAALMAFEYGAQAMAIHGGLLAARHQRRAPPAYLAALRQGELAVERLDDIPHPLTITAQRLAGDWGNASYQCEVKVQERWLARSRTLIMAMPPR